MSWHVDRYCECSESHIVGVLSNLVIFPAIYFVKSLEENGNKLARLKKWVFAMTL